MSASADATSMTWPRGLVCTVRPERGQLTGPRRTTFVTRRKIDDISNPDYERLYSRAHRLGRARLVEMREELGRPIGAIVIARGWDLVPLRGGAMAFASLTLDVSDGAGDLLGDGFADVTAGFEHAHRDELALFQKYEGRIFDELYVDFDFRSSETDLTWIVSYGEYVEHPTNDLEPFVERAEARAAFYAGAMDTAEAPLPQDICGRDGILLKNIGKKTGFDNLVDVLLTFAAGQG